MLRLTWARDFAQIAHDEVGSEFRDFAGPAVVVLKPFQIRMAYDYKRKEPEGRSTHHGSTVSYQ